MILRFNALLGVLFVFSSIVFFAAVSETRSPLFLFRFSTDSYLRNGGERTSDADLFLSLNTSCSPQTANPAFQLQPPASFFAKTQITDSLPLRSFSVPSENFRALQPIALNARSTNERLSQRERLFQSLNVRAEKFRRFSAYSGINVAEAQIIIENGWRKISKPFSKIENPAAFDDGKSEIDFLLETLSFFPDSISIRRARHFLQPSDGVFCRLNYSPSEQLRFAAVQFTEKISQGDLRVCSDLPLLNDWNKDSQTLLTAALAPPIAPAVPELPSIPLNFAFFSPAQLFDKLAAQIWISALFETRRRVVVPSDRFSGITDFQKFHTLSAGRKHFLLI